ncbi:MAG: site-specific integrase [Actinobacteria bacterium]|nr:site-specific integrase [Actinomycetota bacterium]
MAHVQDLWEKTVRGRRVRTSRYGKGNRWQARYLDPDGHERTRTFARKQDAERFVVTVRADVLRGAYVDPDAGKVTFAEFAVRWLAAQTFDESSREATELRLRLHASRHFGHRELRTIKPSVIQAWLRRLQQELAPGYVRTVFTNVSSVFNAAVDDGLITSNPCRAGSVKLPKREQRKIEPWPIEQVEAVLAALPDRYRTAGVVAAGCGLRQGEVFGLRVRDIDFLRRQLHVEQQVKLLGGRVMLAPPKGGKTRTVPLPDAVGAELAKHLSGWPAQGADLVFTSREGNPINRNHFNPYTWKPALQAAGVPPTRGNGMHALRHFYASVLIDAGESVRAVADYLGHADPGFTLRVYAHLFPSSEERARKAVDRLLTGQGPGSVTAPAYDDGASRRPR